MFHVVLRSIFFTTSLFRCFWDLILAAELHIKISEIQAIFNCPQFAYRSTWWHCIESVLGVFLC